MLFHIHIGVHKTATTLFKKFCQANSDYLATQGWFWPSFNVGEDNFDKNDLADAFYSNDETIKQSAADYIKRCAHEASTRDLTKVMLSVEHFCNFHPDRIKLVSRALSDYDVKILLSVRNIERAIPSRLLERIKVPQTFIPSQDLWVNLKRGLDYGAILKNWGAAFGDDSLSVINYEDFNGEPIPHYLKAFGINADTAPNFQSGANISLPTFVLTTFFTLGLLQTAEDYQRLSNAVRQVKISPPTHNGLLEWKFAQQLARNTPLDFNHDLLAPHIEVLRESAEIDLSPETAQARATYLEAVFAEFQSKPKRFAARKTWFKFKL